MVKSTNRKLQTFIYTCLRRILKIRWTDKVPNEEIWRQTKQESIDTQKTRRIWGWIGHSFRKPASNTTRQALFWNPQGEKKTGPASEYLEAKHRRRTKEMGDHLAQVTEDCPKQSAIADGC
ncbi:hypothetical protein ElyMa_005580700 [Elysia marginata]|uniref:Uncharacterized protein n=1 Tax=Elysia marginata TaxID=1093978 RepID=A0AAV4F1U7_9GAST|nr:hypothetical protein ElyMa_005580700 [Elysia marginata]